MGKASSSSSDDSSRKPKEKKKKSKKKKEKTKKEKGNSKKDQKREELAETWNCERSDAVRQLVALLQLDPNIDEELAAVFSAIDSSETVRIDGLENKQARKKLRHLLQAFRLTQLESGLAYRSSELKVSFSAIFRSCLAKAKEQCAAMQPAQKEPKKSQKEIKEENDARARKAEATVKIHEKYCSAANLAPEAEEKRDEEDSALKGPEVDDFPSGSEKKKRKVGPQLPGASVGPAGGDGDASEESGDEQTGPRGEGQERHGVDLDNLAGPSAREEWMTTPHASLAGAFVDGNGTVRGIKADRFEVKRSAAEQEAFEKLFKAKKPSLLEQQRSGAFAGAEEEQTQARKIKVGTPDIWGMSSKEQAAGAMRPTTAPQLLSKKSFDPEQDLKVRKPITSDGFSELVENSGAALEGRFSRGSVATSFL